METPVAAHDKNLRRVGLGDVPVDQARHWRNLPAVWHWCRQYTHLSEGDHERWVERLHSDPSIKMFGVYDETSTRASGDAVGVCGFTSIDRINQSAEFSLYINPAVQGRGFGRAALLTLLHHGFHDHNLQRIWGEVFEGNPAMRMFTALGFVVEGTRRKSYFRAGRFIDSVLISILREEMWSRYA